MEEFDIEMRIRPHLKQRGADEFAASDDGDFSTLEFNIVAGEEPDDCGRGCGIESAMTGKPVDIFFGRDEGGNFVGYVLVLDRELEDDAVDCRVGVRGLNCLGEFVVAFYEFLFDYCADVFAISDF